MYRHIITTHIVALEANEIDTNHIDATFLQHELLVCDIVGILLQHGTSTFLLFGVINVTAIFYTTQIYSKAVD